MKLYSPDKCCNTSSRNQSAPSTPVTPQLEIRQQELEPTKAYQEHDNFQHGVQFSGLVMNDNDSRQASGKLKLLCNSGICLQNISVPTPNNLT